MSYRERTIPNKGRPVRRSLEQIDPSHPDRFQNNYPHALTCPDSGKAIQRGEMDF